MLNRMQRWIASRRQPQLDWLQIELTSRCTASCQYCPRTLYGPQWQNRDMSPDLFRKLLPTMKSSRLVHLQGWGEPLLHPDFFALVRLAKQQGCAVSTTTNGMLIGDREVQEILDSGLDMISFSLAGFDGINDAIRAGTDSSRITALIRQLHLKKVALRRQLPKIHVSYMLLSSTLSEVERLPHKLAGIGVDEVVISTLDLVSAKEQLTEAIRPVSRADYAWLCDELSRIAEQCLRVGLQVHYRIPAPEAINPTCAENVLKSAFVSADGTVSPCVFAALPVSGDTSGSAPLRMPHERICFGSVATEVFPLLWISQEAAQFRSSFGQVQNMHTICRTCPKRFE